MHNKSKKILLIALPFADISIPSIQLSVLESYLSKRDIDVKSRHLYLKAAEIYGVNNYKYLINFPNNPYSAQIGFIKYVFPKHWIKIQNEINKLLFQKKENKFNLDFNLEEYLIKTEMFYNWFFESIDWQSYDIIGFSINYGQLLPSLAISKKIKEINSNKKIVFGGSTTISNLGMALLKSFNYIDFIISGDGEEALYMLASDYENYKSIPGLIHRKNEKIVFNSPKHFNINNLPILTFDSFYHELDLVSEKLRQNFDYFGRLPIEFSRGCWWNKCTFCNQKILHSCYSEKDIEAIIEELQVLSDKYEILSYQVMGSVLSKNNYGLLLEKIIELNRDFTFFAEARPGYLKEKDYQLLKKAGFSNIQTGIESFSTKYLQKMEKGTKVIDNIAALKFCKDNEIYNNYNIVVGYPNEEKIDFDESLRNINLFKSFLDPPKISPLNIEYGSPIFNNLNKYNIKELISTELNKILFPEEYLKNNFTYSYGYVKKQETCNNDWDKLVKDWIAERQEREVEAIKSKMVIDKLILFFEDGRNFLKVYDKRNKEDIKIYTLNKLERGVFLSCINIISYDELIEKFSDIEEFKIAAILQTFEMAGIIYQEDGLYVTLPLRCNSQHNYENNQERKTQEICYNSGINLTL